MNSKHMMTMACAAAICGSVLAENSETTNNGTPIVSAEVSLAFDSKFLSYGLVDNNEPILTPAASLTFFDWLTFGVSSIFDVTNYGRDAGYGDRAWNYQELDPSVTLGHSFGPDDADWLPTTVEFEVGYMYEQHPKSVDDDTQFVNFAVSLPDLWLVPTFAYELDVDRDHGTYLNLELAHTFTLIPGENEDEDDVLGLRLSVAQGWGDEDRVNAYLDQLSHAGLMDTSLKGQLDWKICEWATLSAYIAYYDYLLDPTTRAESRRYEATGSWENSWNVVTGLSLQLSF